jgi:hypothetical protein
MPKLEVAERGDPDTVVADRQNFDAHQSLDGVVQRAREVLAEANAALEIPPVPGHLIAKEYSASLPLQAGYAEILRGQPPHVVNAMVRDAIQRGDRTQMVAWASVLSNNRRTLEADHSAALRELEDRFPALDHSPEYRQARDNAVKVIEWAGEWKRAIPRKVDTSAFRYR